jgi:two-component system, sensor histidine kinase and response regulator
MSTPSILNVDDYAPGLYARTKVLKQAGFSVLEAMTGGQTLDMVSERMPAVVLLDVNLPDMSGFDVCERIKKNPKTSSTTVVHISASHAQSQHLVQGLNCGADSYLVEPVDPAVLVATIRAFLRTREAESALRRSNEELQRFAYMVAHELSEPLRTVNAHTQMLAKQLQEPLDERTSECIDNVLDGGRRMRAFIDDILKYSQAIHENREFRPVQGEAMLGNVIANLFASIENSGVQITHDPMPDFVADARIEQVFQNLISNAIKYRRPGVRAQVRISAQPVSEGWQFSVKDNGLGIETKYMEQIFHIFRRLQGREIPGNGIGLALSQKIVEAHGGRIWVESEPGVGSTFHFTVPQRQASSRAV